MSASVSIGFILLFVVSSKTGRFTISWKNDGSWHNKSSTDIGWKFIENKRFVGGSKRQKTDSFTLNADMR